MRSSDSNNYRFERKWIFNTNYLDLLSKSYKSNFNFKIQHPKRTVNSLYFDDYNQTSVKQNLDGITDKSKIRLRWYGKNSFLRSYYNIPFYKINYNQSAIVMNFNHSKNHFNTAYEIFLSNGPLATLPMKNYNKKNFKSTLIWSEKSSYVNKLLSLETNIIQDIIEEKISKYLGNINNIESLKKFPLSAHICRKFYD